MHAAPWHLTVSARVPASFSAQFSQLYVSNVLLCFVDVGVLQLLASLVDAAERLRQFSPVKEQLSSAVLEEVRFRLYRIVSPIDFIACMNALQLIGCRSNA